MPWTTPETFTAGQTLTAASMNVVSGNLNEVAPFFGAWTSYTPVFTQTGKTISSYTQQIGAYIQIGRLVIARAHIVLNSVSGTGTGRHTITLPVNSSITTDFKTSTYLRYPIGYGYWVDSGVAAYPATWALISQGAVTNIVTDSEGQSINVGTSDSFQFTVMYEAAT